MRECETLKMLISLVVCSGIAAMNVSVVSAICLLQPDYLRFMIVLPGSFPGG